MESPALLDRERRGVLATYVTAVAFTSVAYVAFFQNASVLAPAVTGTAATGGLPSSAAVAGTAIGAFVLSGLMASRGRRAGIVTGIGLAIGGAALALVAALLASFPLLLAAGVLFGFGNAAIALSRYAAADLYPEARRPFAVGVVVWASTVGAVAGPNLLAPSNGLGQAVDLPRFAGGFAMGLVAMLVALAVALLGPRVAAEGALPARTPAPPGTTGRQAPRTPIGAMLTALLATTRGRTAVAALVSGQLVMVLIMTMTPFHLDHAGHGDGVIGIVLSAHMLGMFALAPISGRLTERFGAASIVTAGMLTLAVAGVLGAAAPVRDGVTLMVPLFLLGFGWNLSFVAGSSLLAAGEAYADRARLQGVVDALVWGTAAVAGVLAGFVVELAGYAVLSLSGAALAILLTSVIAVDGRTVREVGA